MSRDVASLVYSRRVGSMARKAVLAYFAERANDDGTGIWSSKSRIADECECSKQTAISTIRGLEADGILRVAGRRKSPNGYTVEYDIVLSAVRALPAAKRPEEDVQILTGPNLDRSGELTPRGQPTGPKPSLNLPSEAKASSGDASRPHKLPEDWVAPVLSALPSAAKALVQQWPRGAYEATCETFRLHWISETRAIGRKTNWLAALGKWLISDHSKVMKDARAGVSFERLAPALVATATPSAEPVPERMVEGGTADALRTALRKVAGKRSYEQWFDPAAFLLRGEELRIIVRSAFDASYIESNFRPALLSASQAAGLSLETILVEVTAGSPSRRRSASNG